MRNAYNLSQQPPYETSQYLKVWFSALLLITVLFGWQLPAYAQNDTPCECTGRWEEGASWNPNGSINDAPNAPAPNGIIRCGSSAETQSNIDPFYNCVYNSSLFPIDPTGVPCVDPSSGDPVTVLPPTNGQPIIWLNFDVRPSAGSFEIQINDNSGDLIGWALYSSDVITNGVSTANPTGGPLSGDCGGLTLRACGTESSSSFNTLPVPNFTKTTNYYIAIWDQNADGDLRLNNFKARYGCGDADVLVCSIEGQVDTVCIGDGSAYTLEIPINGINGEFIAYEQNQGVFSGPICLTNPAEPNPVTSGTFQFNYSAGDSYDIIIFETTKDPNSPPITPVVTPDDNCLHPSPFPDNPASNGNADDCVLTFTGGPLPSPLQCGTISDVPISCTGNGSDGQATASPFGGSPPYQYLWDNGETAQTATMLSPGPHTVAITDALGCTVTCNVNILPAQNCCTCDNAPIPTCPGPVDLGCNPALDANGRPIALGAGEQYQPDVTLVTVITDPDCTATVTFEGDGNPTTTDGCHYTLIRTYRATNDCEGLFDDCTQIFTWTTDNTPPTWDQPPGALDVSEVCAADVVVPGPPTATDNCPGNLVTVSIQSDVTTPTAAGCDDQYTRVITYIATDDCGGNISAPYTVAITVNDNVAPTWNQAPGALDVSEVCADDVVAPGPPTAADNCPGNTATVSVQSDVTTPTAAGCDDQYTRVITYIATDECGNVSAPYTVTITVNDNVAPTWNQAPGALDVSEVCADDVVAPGPPTAADNCPGNAATVSVQSDVTTPTAAGCGDQYTRVITYIATDECGNVSAPYTVTITVNDNVAPTWNQAPGALDVSEVCADDVVAPGPPTAADNCPGNAATVSVQSDVTTPTAAGCDDQYTRVITYIATDECGNVSAPYTVAITVNDNVAPTWNQAPGALDVSEVCADDVVAPGPPTAADNCPGNAATVSVQSDVTTPTAAGCDDQYTRVITYIATDECGNVSAPYTVTITVNDNVAPTWNQAPGALDVSEVCADDVVAPGPPTATDNCPGNAATVSVQSDVTTPTAAGCDDQYTRVITYIATDECGNISAPYTVAITVNDNVAPTWNQAPGALDVSEVCADDVVAPGPPTAADNCPGNTATVSVQSDVTTPTAAGCGDQYTRVITYIATDECGNVSAPYTVAITVNDNVAPTWNQAPGALDVSEVCADDVVAPGPPTAADNCPGNAATVSVQSDVTTPTAAGCDDQYTRVITYIATDECGNVSAPYTVAITVNDNVAPTWNQAPGALDVSEVCADDVVAPGPPTAADNCPGNAATVSVQSDVTTPTAAGCDDQYTRVITYIATDECGNVSAPYTVTITVNDNVAPTWNQAPGALDVSEVCADDVVAPGPPTAADNCPGNAATVSVQSDVTTPTAAGCGDQYTRVITYIATDECGNVSAPYTVTITVNDNVAPTWNQAPGALDVSEVCADDVVAPGPPTAADNCPGNTATVSVQSDVTTPTAAGCDDQYTRVITYIATDECGNVSAPYTVTITVNDNVAPTWNQAPGALDVSEVCADDVVAPGPPTAADNCPGNAATVSVQSDVTTPTAAGCGDQYTRVITYIATDECGNVSAPYTVAITVNDNVAPTWNQAPGALDVSEVCADDVVAPGPPTAADNCPGNTATVSVQSDVTTPTAAGCDDQYTRVITYIATDECGNVSAPYTVAITVNDNVAPTWNQAPGALDVSEVCADDVVTPGPPTAADNCPGNAATVSVQSDVTTPTAAGCDDQYTRVITYIATDECGNVSAPYTVAITVNDNVAPTWNQAPGALDVSEVCADDVVAPGPPTATDNCPGNAATVSVQSDVTTPTAAGCDDQYTRVITYIATDECGNISAPYTVAITVNDNVAPTWNQAPGALDVSEVCADDVVAPGPPTAADNCPGNTATVSVQSDVTTPTAAGCDDQYTRVITYIATDECGNISAPYTVAITVNDNVAPTWNQAPGALDVSEVCADDVVAPGPPTAADNCPGNAATVNVQSDVTTPTAAGCGDQYTRVITYIATDECGNVSAPYTVTITVNDNVAPTFANCTNGSAGTIDLGCVGVPPAGNRAIADAGAPSDNCNLGGNTPTAVKTSSNTVGCTTTDVWEVSIKDACGNTGACTITYTYILSTGLTVSACPGDPMLDGCSTQEEIDIAWNSWITGLLNMTASGGCNPQIVYSQTPATLPKPQDCVSDKQVVSVSVIAIDQCGQSQPVTCTFTVKQPAPLAANCPSNVMLSNCLTQNEVNNAFAAWIAQFSASGGCNAQGSDLSQYVAPSFCGGTVTVRYEATDDCGQTDDCSATFTVATGLAVSCPLNVNLGSCLSQAEVNQAFNNWVGQFTTTGGCDPQSTDLSQYSPPAFCGGRVTVIYKAKDICGREASCTATFSVAGPAPLEVSCPNSVSIGSCFSQAQVNSAFAAWIGQFSTSGGCFAESSNLQSYEAPSYCGGSVTVKYYAWDRCGQSDQCSATFTVAEPAELTVHCPGNLTVNGCSSQAQINAAFNTWRNQFTVSGGCSPQSSSLQNYTAPSGCGGSVTINYYAWDKCGNWDNCSATFTVSKPALLTVSCPQDVVLSGCSTQAQINSAFAAWLGQFSRSGGCYAQSSSLQNYTAPSACGGSVTVNYYAWDKCGQSANCSATFTVSKPQPLAVSCPQNKTMAACSSQSAINTAFNSWKAQFGASGGCGRVVFYYVNGQQVSSLSNVSAPPACGGSVSIALLAVDKCQQQAYCSAVFSTKGDAIPPKILPAKNAIVECDGHGNTTMLNKWLAAHGGATATDNCGQVFWSHNFTGLTDGCGATGSATVTFTATDLCGNTASTAATFSIVDTRPPVGACPQGLSGLSSPSQAPGPNIAAIQAAYSDNCGGITVTHTGTTTQQGGGCSSFEVRHSYRITDNCGLSTNCTVVHSGGSGGGAITGNCPPWQSGLECDGGLPEFNAAYLASFFTGADGQPVTATPTDTVAVINGCAFQITYHYVVRDNCGNQKNCSIRYSGEDDTPPSGACPQGGVVQTYAQIPRPDTNYIRQFYSDNCSDIRVSILPRTSSGGPCRNVTIYNNYEISDWCGNTVTCSVPYFLAYVDPNLAVCPPGETLGFQCWEDVPTPDEAKEVFQYYFTPGSVVTFIAQTVTNNYCEFIFRYAYQIEDPCLNERKICTLTFKGQDLTPPAPIENGGCPEGLSGLACQTNVPAADPAAVAAGYSDNCSSVHAYLINTIRSGNPCGNFTVTYQYHVYDDCDNFVVCEVTHSGTGPDAYPQANLETAAAPQGSEALDMTVYPNPTAGEAFLEFEHYQGERAELVIYNVFGKRLITRPLILDNSTYRLDLAEEGLASGSYFISVQTERTLIVRTIVLNKF